MFLLKFGKKKAQEEQIAKNNKSELVQITNDNDKAPMLTRERRSLSEAQLPNLEERRKRGVTFLPTVKKQEKEIAKVVTNPIFRRNKNLFLSQAEVKKESNAYEVEAFINAVKKSCPDDCKDNGGYFATLNGDYMKMLITIAEAEQFEENLVFLQKFNDYMKNNIKGEDLYSSLEVLNLDDNDDKKNLVKCESNNSLNSDSAKKSYQEIASYISTFLDFNLRIKQPAIRKALQGMKGMENS